MSWREVIINNQAKLDYKMGYLVVRGEETRRVLIEDIEILVIENPAVSITGILLYELIERKVKVVFCDGKRNPVAELIPHHGSHDSSSKIRIQSKWDDEVKALVWREIVKQKINNQYLLLREMKKDEEAELLFSYINQVELNDSTNREGHAAKVYFNAMFGMEFTRTKDIPVNAALNYGYSILLSAFNREISANGYLTQLGIFHCNMFNHFNLASDLMEPYRILVDRKVYYEEIDKFEKEEKHKMWEILGETVIIDGCRQQLSNAIKMYTKSVFDAINVSDVQLIKAFEFEYGERNERI